MTIYLPTKYHNMLCAADLQIIIYSHIGTLIGRRRCCSASFHHTAVCADELGAYQRV